jgi:hypothetical protein
MAWRAKEGGGLLIFGMLLIAAGILQYKPELLGWARRLFPIMLMAAGIARIISFARRRRPRSAFGGALLVMAGAAMLIARENPGLSPLQLYGRYWPLLLVLFATVKIVGHYSSQGSQRQSLSPGEVFIAGLIILSGLLANKLAARGLWLIQMPRPISGRAYTFSDQLLIGPLGAGSKLSIRNDYGDIVELRATLVKRVRAWDIERAQGAAKNISLQVDRAGDRLQISIGRGQVAAALEPIRSAGRKLRRKDQILWLRFRNAQVS